VCHARGTVATVKSDCESLGTAIAWQEKNRHLELMTIAF
jgi:hypothetical protein